MARENGILADKFNTCPLDKPVPLSIYKNLKTKDIPRVRPKSLRDYMRIAMKYSKKSEKFPLDETDYNKEALEDMIRHWFTLARTDDYIIEQILREFDLENPDFGIDNQGSNTWDDFWAEFLPPDPNSSNSDTWAEFFNEFAPLLTPVVAGEPVTEETPDYPYAQPLNGSSDDSQEVVITSQNPDFALPDHLQVVTSSSGNESNENESSFSEDANEDYPAGLTEEEYQILVNEFGEEEVLRQFS